MQEEIHKVLLQNVGNRLTHELINGLTARLEMIGMNSVNMAVAAVRAEQEAKAKGEDQQNA